MTDLIKEDYHYPLALMHFSVRAKQIGHLQPEEVRSPFKKIWAIVTGAL
jgi:hypothetical protein